MAHTRRLSRWRRGLVWAVWRIAKRNKERHASFTAPAWILIAGFWDDSGIWDDSGTWND